MNEKAPRTRPACFMSALSCYVLLFLLDFVYLDGVLCITALMVTWYDAYTALQRRGSAPQHNEMREIKDRWLAEKKAGRYHTV